MVTKYESLAGSGKSELEFYAPLYTAQSFTPQVSHTLTKLVIPLRYRRSQPVADAQFDVYLADGNHKPTGASLAHGTVSYSAITNTWTQYDIALTPQPELTANVEYVIVLKCTTANYEKSYAVWHSYSGNEYTRGVRLSSSDSGATWTVQADQDSDFEEWGNPPPQPPTAQTDAATSILITQATLNGTLLDDAGQDCDLRFNYGKTTSYGINTDWQTPKHTNDQVSQIIASLDANTLYHFSLEAKNSAGTVHGADQEFTTTPIPPAVGKDVKALIRHPALKQVRVIAEGQEIANYDLLSDPEQQRIETALEIPCPTPCTVEVTTLADQIFSFEIPFKS